MPRERTVPVPVRYRGYASIVCPQCEGDRVEEVSEGVMFNQIDGFYHEYPEYGDSDFDDSRVIRIQCMDCYFEFLNTNEERYPNNLFRFFREKGWLDIEAENNEVSWEV